MDILMLICAVGFAAAIIYLQAKKYKTMNRGLTNTLCVSLGVLAICSLVLAALFFRIS